MPLCLFNINCRKCKICNISDTTNDFSYCNYANLFCYDYSFETPFFQPSIINEYAKNLRTDTDINNFCGNEKFIIKPSEKEEIVTIFTTKDKIFPKNKIVHCNFNITKEEEKKLKDIRLFFEISEKENPNNNNLKFNITCIRLSQGYYDVFRDLQIFIDEKIRNETYEYYLDDINEIQL